MPFVIFIRRLTIVSLSSVLIIVGGIALPGRHHLQAIVAPVASAAPHQATPPCPPPPPDEFPVPPGCEPKPVLLASSVCLRLATHSDSVTPPSGNVTYQLIAHNGGPGDATSVQVTVPILADTQTVQGATFTTPSGWVSALRPGEAELRLGPLSAGETTTATLLLHSSATTLGGMPTTRARLEWIDERSAGAGLSNRVSLTIGDSATGPAALDIAPAGTPTIFAATYDGFASHEVVSLWYHRPDGSVAGLGELRADASGRIVYNLDATSFASGSYMLVAHGHCSQMSAIGTFAVAAAPQ